MFVPQFLARLNRRPPPPKLRDPSLPFSTYESRAPSAQNCVDAIPGWVSAFPPGYDVKAGKTPLFNDARIQWMMDHFGPLSGANVLELGPLEGAHTSMLDAAGATVTAIEANKQAFLKCLVTKELLGLARAKFLLGDCIQYLEQNETRYDLVLASGVLYHMPAPFRFLDAVAARTDAIYLWTQYVDEDAVEPGTKIADGFARIREVGSFKGVTTTLYPLGYCNVHLNDDFCGGIYDYPRWASRASILGVLNALGFGKIEIAHEANTVPHQPSFSIFARR